MSIFKLPDLGEGLADAIIRKWHVKAGDSVTIDDPLVTVETAKATVEVPAPQTGVVEKIYAGIGKSVNTGKELVSFVTTNSTSATVVGQLAEAESVTREEVAMANFTSVKNKVKAIPAARSYAKAHNLDLEIACASNGVCISLQDIKNYHNEILASSKQNIQNNMCAAMELSKKYVVPATIIDDINVHSWYTNKPDVTVKIIQAIVVAAKQQPKLNAHFENISKQLILCNEIHLGIAVQTQSGLFAPTIKFLSEDSTAATIRTAVDELKDKAINNCFTKDDLTQATIVYSNIGSIAGRYSTPIVVPPTVAIIATGKISKAVVCENEQTVVRYTMPVSITFDHRAITGAEAALFMKDFATALS